MDMVVVFGALFVGLIAAVPAQITVYILNLQSHYEAVLVCGAFAAGALISAPIIANFLGV